MNYNHEPQDSLQQNFWISMQSTMVPVAIFRKLNGLIVQEAMTFISTDTNHDNKMVQHILSKVISHYQKQVLKDDGVELKHVYLWTDGCAAQFKCRFQFHWLSQLGKYLAEFDRRVLDTEGILFDVAGKVPIVSHSFFASCHGKGPCDALAGIYKSWLNEQEVRGVEIVDARDAFTRLNQRFGRGDMTQENDPQWIKKRRRLHAEMFDFINSTDVNHTDNAVVATVEGTQSYHCYSAIPRKEAGNYSPIEGRLWIREVTCICPACRAFDYDHCTRGDLPPGHYEDIKYMANDVAAKESVRKKVVKRAKDWTKGAKKGEIFMVYAPQQEPNRPTYMPTATDPLKKVNRSLVPPNDDGLVLVMLAEDVPPHPPVRRGTASIPTDEPTDIDIKVHVPIQVGDDQGGVIDFTFPNYTCCEADGQAMEAPAARGTAVHRHAEERFPTCPQEESRRRYDQEEHRYLTSRVLEILLPHSVSFPVVAI